jgi:hypothetical protein
MAPSWAWSSSHRAMGWAILLVASWSPGWLYEDAARRARVDCMIELRPSTCFGRVHVGASTKFIRILGVGRRLNSRGRVLRAGAVCFVS